MDAPPETPRREVTDVYHGEEVVDPYRWLEADDGAVADWVARQNEYADRLLHAPTRERLRPEFEDLARMAEYHTVVARGGSSLQRVRGPDDERPVLCVRDGPGGDRRPLVDPNRWGGARSIDWYVPSPDGSLVACAVAEGGDEQHDLHVVEVATGDRVDAVTDAGRVHAASFAWAGDGFYYGATGSAGGGGQLDKEVRHRELATGVETVVADEFGPSTWPALVTDPAGETAVLARSEMSGSDDVYVIDGGSLRPVLAGFDATFVPSLAADVAYFRTDYRAPRGRVLACPVEDLADGPYDPADLREVVPEGEGVLREVAPAGDRLVVHRHRDAHSTLAVRDPDGEGGAGSGDAGQELPLPAFSTVGELSATPDRPECFLRVQSFDRAPAVVRADAADGTTRTLDEPDVGPEVDLTVEQHSFESADGTEVPAFVVHRSDLARDGDNPAVLTGYGGFRVNRTPTFGRFRLPFLADGGVFAVANLRGGAEFGEAWHRAATRADKQRTFEDFLAAAGFLCSAGYTRPERLAAVGGSNGGLTVGAAITQRPGQFGAAIAAVPLCDMLRFHEFLLGASWTTEYGSPDDPDLYPVIRAYSPYHNVEAREYPAVLFTTATGDTRVHPAHARKMCARLQAASTSGEPVLLRTNDETGHGVGKPRSMVVEEALDRWTFLYDRLGVDG